MKTTITHPTATEIEFHDGSLTLEYTLHDASGNAVGPRVRASVGIADDYVARKLAETMGFDAGLTESRWRVNKDTLITRITDAGKLADARTLYGSQNAANKFDFDQMCWCWNTNVKIRGFVTELGLDPDVILARDDFL